jgi:predicted RNase H-like HicB family nuclease
LRYKIIIEKEAENGYSVYVPALPGCASQGETIREAMSNIKKAIKLYLWSIEEDRKALAKPHQVFIKDIAIST